MTAALIVALATTALAHEPAAEHDDARDEADESPALDESAWASDKLDRIERRITSLQRRNWQSRATMRVLLAALSDPRDESRLHVAFGDDLGRSWVISKVRLYVDGKAVFYDAGPGDELRSRIDGELYSHAIPAGTHQIVTELSVRWRGLVGKPGPTVNIRSAQAVDVGRAETVNLTIEPGLQPFASTPFLERPEVRYQASSTPNQR